MGKIIHEKINTFTEGMTADFRNPSPGSFRLARNFNAHSFPYRLVPTRSAVSITNSATKVQNMTVALSAGDDYRIYGLGVDAATTKAEVYEMSVGDTSWGTISNSAASSHTATDFELFVYYPKTGRIYGAADGTTIWAMDPAAAVAFDESDGNDQYAHTLATSYNNPRSSSATNRPYLSGLVHSKDDVLYVAYDNIIISNAGTGDWTDPALTLPTDRIITSICEYGNYLAIATKHVSDSGNSVVYLWDRDSSLSTLSESIDFGEGNLHILEEIDGFLIGISIAGTTVSQLFSKLVFRISDGTKARIFNQFVSEATYASNDLPRIKQKVNSHLYFMAEMTLSDAKQEGIWKIGRPVGQDNYSVVFDRAPNNDSALTSSELHAFLIVGDVVWQSFTDDSTLKMTKTDTTTSYSMTSVYEKTFVGGDPFLTKKIKGIRAVHEPLVSTASCVLKYKKDEETSFTTLKTNTTDNSMRTSAVKDSSGNTLPRYKECTVRAEITGGNNALLGVELISETVDDDIIK